MDKNKFDLTTPDNSKKAQADSSPELSSVFDEFTKGIDLQPLDDVEASEFIEFEDNVSGDIPTEDEPKKKEDKKEPISEKEGRRFLNPKLIRVIIVVLLVIAVFTGIYMVFFHQDYFSYSATSVYEKDGNVVVSLENGEALTLEDVSQIKLSDDGNILVYSQDSDSKTGKYDIRVIDFTRRTSVRNKGSIIVNGINSDWTTDKNGSFVYYQKTENKSDKYYAYSTESRETNLVVADAVDYFIPPVGDIVYYTREHGDETMLYRVRFGEEPESLGDAENITAVSNDEIMEVFFTIPDDDVESESFTLYKISSDKGKTKISENVSEVYLDNYTPGGNLYYFVKNDAKLNWNDFINDPYSDSDAAFKKPDKQDYFVTVGFIFKRTILDELSYNRALKNYDKKLIRDKIRTALDELDLGLAVSAEYKVKVYDGQMSKELAGSVKLENLLAFAETGAPRIIYKTTGIDSDKQISLDELYKIAVSKSVEDSIDYVINNLDDNYHMSKGFKYSMYDGNKVVGYDFVPVEDSNDPVFSFADRKTIVTCSKSSDTHASLYVSTVGEKEIEGSVLVSDNVISYEVTGNGIYYTKENNEAADLYFSSCSGDSLLLCESNIQYMTTDSGNVIAFKGDIDSDLNEKVEIILYENGKINSIDNNVSFKYFALDKDDFAYIKDYQTAAASDTQTQSGGKLMVYSDGKTDEVDSGVSQIFDINYN